MATKFEKKSAITLLVSPRFVRLSGDFAIKLCNDVREILKGPTQVAMAKKFETK